MLDIIIENLNISHGYILIFARYFKENKYFKKNIRCKDSGKHLTNANHPPIQKVPSKMDC